jgi:hypothetical protein
VKSGAQKRGSGGVALAWRFSTVTPRVLKHVVNLGKRYSGQVITIMIFVKLVFIGFMCYFITVNA